MDLFTVAIIWFLVFLFSTVCHEAAHAYIALKLGDRTAYLGGQVSLNPLPHIQREPVGMIIVPILSFMVGRWMFGWASCPYDPYWAQQHPRRCAYMSLAGPAANLILVIIAGILIQLGVYAGWFYAPDSISGMTDVTVATSEGVLNNLAIYLSIIFSLNLILFIFNLIPLPPLDGSGIIQLSMDRSAAQRYQQFISQPHLAIIGIVVAWKLFDLIYDPIFTLALNILYPGSGYHNRF